MGSVAARQPSSNISVSGKRRHTTNDSGHGVAEPEQHPLKKTRTSLKRTSAKPGVGSSKKIRTAKSEISRSSASLPTINQVPTKILTILVFGNGECGELGLGPKQKEALRPCVNPYLDPNNPSEFHVVQLACGGMHTVALTADNKIITWGVNDNGALGRDTDWDGGLRDIDADEDSEDDEQLNPHESIPTTIPSGSFPPGTRFAQVAAGDSCSFVLTDTGFVYGWGAFVDGEGNKRFGYDTDGKLIEKQEKPVLIPGLKKITQITCGANHSLALDITGRIWGWGSGGRNQLGRRLFGRHQESLKPHLVEVCRNNARYIASGEYHSFAIDRKDNVWAWGLNSYGEAGYTKTAGSDSVLQPYPMKITGLCGKGVTVLAGGLHHSAAVTADGQCLVWGQIDGGQLGIAFTSEQLEDETLIRYDEHNKPRICLRPTLVPNTGKVVYVGCGTDHTIFVNEEGHGYATGFGSMGQLGLGNEEDVEVAQHIHGKVVEDKMLTWAGAGGQFSVMAATVTDFV